MTQSIFTIHRPSFPSDSRPEYLQSLLGKTMERGTPFGGYTVVYTLNSDDHGARSVRIAVAFCNPADMYSKKRGRGLAVMLLEQGAYEVDHFRVSTQELAPDMLESDIRPTAFRPAYLDTLVDQYVATHLEQFRATIHNPKSLRARLAQRLMGAEVPPQRPAYVQEQLSQEAPDDQDQEIAPSRSLHG